MEKHIPYEKRRTGGRILSVLRFLVIGQAIKEGTLLAPSERGLSAIADWGSDPSSVAHPLHRFAVPLKVNCPAGAREATLGCPLRAMS